ncbi:hypothetical protein [Sphingopyxis macrogoltabida]|uniref:hypothetical protein n=1 Tax=Sphingopyxis macrogoltabida TaxID=33050 RepID=UPI0006CAAA92|nr:hypothetical protein [Sphingopyxis macrogoltabida]
MPRLIDPPAGPAYDLEEVAARLDESGVDLADEASLARCAALLAGLQRNRDFLADRVIAELKASYRDQLETNRYSAQVFLLHRSPRGYFLRANLWPAERWRRWRRARAGQRCWNGGWGISTRGCGTIARGGWRSGLRPSPSNSHHQLCHHL